MEVLYKEDPECVLHVAGQNLTTPDLTCAVEVLYKEDPECVPHVAEPESTMPDSTVVVPEGFVDSNQL